MELFSDWRRYWCPPEGNIPLSDTGFLLDPEEDGLRLITADLESIEAVDETTCVAMLGEPGIGKTTEMSTARRLARARGDLAPWLDLSDYGSEDRLLADLRGSPDIQDWLSTQDQRLTLFLDGLDECLLRISNVAGVLLQALAGLPTSRMRLRIACRSALWPMRLDAGLREFWPEDYRVLELAPLRRVDVALAAGNSLGSDAKTFMAQVADRGVVPLAIKPVTLDLLIRLFQKVGSLPTSQAQLYEQGIVLLCDSDGNSSSLPHSSLAYSARQRAAVASRLAAVMLTGGRKAIWRAPDRGEVEDTDLQVSEAVGGPHEVWDAEIVPVTADAVMDTLRASGLFSLRGRTSRLGWAHQSYADFLAARYLTMHLTTPQIISLVTWGEDRARGIVPQLSSLAAWLATQSIEVFRHLASSDPYVLLSSDVAMQSDSDKREMVTALLDLYDQEKLVDLLPADRGRLAALSFPGIAESLKPFIIGKTRSRFARRVAVDIAESCNVAELQDELLAVALDESDAVWIRSEAAMALSRIGDDDARARLAREIHQVARLDDELLGAFLIASWPGHVTPADVFALLEDREPDSSLIGLYWLFVNDRLVPGLDSDGLVLSLSWGARQGNVHSLPYVYQRLLNGVILEGFSRWSEPGVRDALVSCLVQRIQKHDEFEVPATPNQELAAPGRHVVALEVMDRLDPATPAFFSFLGSGLITSADLPWLLDELLSQTSHESKERLAVALTRLMDIRDAESISQLMRLYGTVPELADALGPYVAPIELDSQDAQRMRRLRRTTAHSTASNMDSESMKRLGDLLVAIEEGEVAKWWELCVVLADIDRGAGRGELQLDIRSLSVWPLLDESIRDRIDSAGLSYAREGRPSQAAWRRPRILDRPALGLVKALILVAHERPEELAQLERDRWIEVGPILLWYSALLSSGTGDHTLLALVCAAYGQATQIMVEFASEVLLAEIEASQVDPSVFEVMSQCWGLQVARFIEESVRDDSYPPRVGRAALSTLARMDPRQATELGLGRIDTVFAGADEFQRALDAGVILLSSALPIAWNRGWAALRQHEDLAREVFLRLSHEGPISVEAFVRQIGTREAAELFMWLSTRFPREQDPNPVGAHMVSPRESLGRWRDGILTSLRDLGSTEALSALRYVAGKMETEPWIRWLLIDAEKVYRRENWRPTQPRELLALVESADARTVSDPAELLAVLTDSLDRLQEELRSTPAAVRALWNEPPEGPSHKGEAALSDLIQLHLRRDLNDRRVVVNREVQIRAAGPGVVGEKLDIQVEALREGAPDEDPIRAVIEVKGDWHKHVNSDIEAQLFDRYLQTAIASAGLYVVGWYGTSRTSVKALRDSLEMKASTLSTPDSPVRAYVLNVEYR